MTVFLNFILPEVRMADYHEGWEY